MFSPRPLPKETIDALRPPARSVPYFQHADAFRFDPSATEFSPVNAWWLADASLMVYGDETFIRTAIDRSPVSKQGYQVDWLGTAEKNRGMVLTNDAAMIVVFRGTRVESHRVWGESEILRVNEDDLWTDSQFLASACRMGGRVHHGFFTAFSQVCDRLDEIVRTKRPQQRLWLAGHSLGGALATIAAAHLGKDAIHGLYTYGSPRVGNSAFVRSLPDRNYFRFVHRGDWASTVPPEMLGYVHAGELRQVTGSRPREFLSDLANHADALGEAVRSMIAEFRLKVGDLPSAVPTIADHAPVYYATLLWNALIANQH